MIKNTLLNITIIICKCIRSLYIVFFLIATGLFVLYQINPSFYENIDLDNTDFHINFLTEKSGITLDATDSYFLPSGIAFDTSSYYTHYIEEKPLENSEVFLFTKITSFSLYINFIKTLAILFFQFLCIKEFQSVIESLKEIKTFQKRNVSSFRRIGKYLLVIFILSSYSSLTFQQGGTSGFHITFTSLILALFAYIMAEIFKEGNKLSEENKLTV